MGTSGDPPGWMEPVDDRILERLDETSRSTMGQIAVRLDRDDAVVQQRCRLLAETGLLEEVYHETYQLTRMGDAYMHGVLDATSLPDPPGES